MLQSILCFAVSGACSLAGRGNDSSLKLLELDMDLLQIKDLAEIFFFFNALADGKYALSTENYWFLRAMVACNANLGLYVYAS